MWIQYFPKAFTQLLLWNRTPDPLILGPSLNQCSTKYCQVMAQWLWKSWLSKLYSADLLLNIKGAYRKHGYNFYSSICM